jgi:hypothetical protein
MTHLEELKEIMTAKKYSRKKIAQITDSSVRTVDGWFTISKVTGQPKRNITTRKLQMVKDTVCQAR